jgi:hypothetical protein
MKLSILPVILVTLLYSCVSKQKIAETKNVSSIYNPGTSYLHPKYLVFHQSDSITQLILQLNLEELLFNQANPENAMQSRVKIQYQLTDISDNAQNKEIADSATAVKKIDKVAGKTFALQTYFLKARLGRTYALKVTLTDMLRGVNQVSYLFVNKLNRYSGQNYKVISRFSDMPMFRNYVFPNEYVQILSNNPAAKKYYIRYRKDDTPLPPPPFSVQSEAKYTFVADSIWVIPYNQSQVLLFQYKGIYLVQTDSTQTDGLFLINAGQSFPKVTEPDMLIPPLEYLCSASEFSTLKADTLPKLAVDNFWLTAGGNTEMARELIRVYYNRMYYANLFFTSYKQGWKTDRGMLYLLFGPPGVITKTATSETWEYYVKQDAVNLSITFNKVPSPYSENHFVMQRNDSYSRYWRAAVDMWRKGKAFSLEE